MSSDKVILEKYVLSGVKSLGQELGRGAYGRVYTVRYDRSIYAAKEIHSVLIANDKGEFQRETFLRECNHCSGLSHPNIVSFKGIFYPQRNQCPAMVMELMDESLTNYVINKPGSSFGRKASILYDVAKGLGYLHSLSPPIIHRDLSPNNVLLKYAGVNHVPPVAKIADLGVAKLVKADSQKTRSQLTQAPGTLAFMPPEALADIPQYDTSLDVFSYGGIMLHTVSEKWPSPTSSTKFDPETRQLRAFTEVERRQEYLDQIIGEAEVLRPLIEACLDNDPNQRPSINDLAVKIEKYKEAPYLLPALQSNCYDIGWTKCAKLPFQMYGASVVSDGKNIFVMAGSSPENDVLCRVLSYDIKNDQWEELPQPGHYWGILHIIDGRLTIIGGSESFDDQPIPTDKVLTYDKDSYAWTNNTYPNMLNTRCKPGVITHSDYVFVAGGESNDGQIRNDIEILNWRKPNKWMKSNVHLPEQMWAISMTISDNNLYILGFSVVDWRYTTAYQVPVDPIILSTSQPSSSDVKFTEIAPVPHWHATVIPNLSPPTIVGGCNSSGNTCTAEICTFDDNTWKTIGSLPTARCGVGIALINADTIIVIGGSTAPSAINLALAHSCDFVERGQVKPTPST